MTFNFDKALASAKDNPALTAFLNANKDGLLQMSEDQIIAIIVAYTGGDFATVINRFFGTPPAPPAAGGVDSIVGNTADIAQRRYDAYQRFVVAGELIVGVIIAALKAGVVL